MGYKLSPSVAVQINYNDLGSASIKNSITQQKVDVGYKVFSADVRKTVWQDQDRWAVFAGAGIDHLNKYSSDASYSKANNVALKLLAGADYTLQPGLYLRPQVETFSTHTAYFSVGLVKYLGTWNKIAALTSIAQPVAKQPEPEKKVAALKSSFSDITFETNSAKITPAAAKILDNATQIINQTNQKFEIQAYTDNRGREAYNLALSQKRAQSMVDYLVAHGVSANRLTAKGYGSANPIADNVTEEGRTQNRRATFQLK